MFHNDGKRYNPKVRIASDEGSSRPVDDGSNVTASGSVDLNASNVHSTMTNRVQSIALSSVAIPSFKMPSTRPVSYRSEVVDPPPLSCEVPRRCSLSRTNANVRARYRVGDALRLEHHSIPPSMHNEDDFFVLLSSRIPLGSHLFVRRSSSGCSCAKLVGRDVYGEILFLSLESMRNVTKMLSRKYWWRCLRLVNDNAVVASDDESPRPAGSSDAISKFASNAEKNDSSRLSYCEERDKLVRSATDLASLCRDFHKGCNIRSDRTIFWSSDPNFNKFRDADLDGKEVNDAAIASSASFLAAIGSISPTTPPSVHVDGSVHGLVKNMAVASDGSITIPSSASNPLKTTTMADISPTSSSAKSYATRTYTRKSSAPELRTIQQRDATSDTTSPSRSSSSIDSHVMVNLNAKTFIGTRRDRFRPRGQPWRSSSYSGLSRLGELL
jgi:hypothetical protein